MRSSRVRISSRISIPARWKCWSAATSSPVEGRRPGHIVQFERQGYFCVDSRDSTPEKLVFNRTVSLKDSWAKIEGKTQ